MPKSRRKRNEHKDFQKVKLKVGKTLKKADNVTNASFQTRTIQVTQKIKTVTGNEPSSKRKLNANELLNQFQHYSTSTRNDAVMGLRELLTSYPEIIVPNLVAVIERTAKLFGDKDPVVRQSVIKLMKVIFPAVSEKQVSPFLHVISAHLCCAMTNIYEDIQADSLQILDLLLLHFPKLVVSSSSQILPNFIEQISRSRMGTKKGSSALSVNPNLKMASHKWRAKVLTRLHKLLSAIIGENEKLDTGSQNLESSVMEKTWEKSNMIFVQPLPQFFALKWTQRGFILRSKVSSVTRQDSGVSLSDVTGVQKFVKLIVPLLMECWVESNTLSTYNNKGTDAMITIDSLPLRTSVVSVIQLLCQYIVQNYPSEVIWLKKMYINDFKIHLLKAFPYSVHIPVKKQAKGDSQSLQESVCNLNIAICDIMTRFSTALSSSDMEDNSWEITLIQFLQDTIRHECLDKHQLQIIIDIMRRLIELDNGLNMDGILDVVLQKYKKSHPLSSEKRLLFYFFSGIILDRNKQCKLGADTIDTFITSLPDLFMTVVKGNQQMAAKVLQVMKTAACQNCWILLQQLNKFICKTIEDKDNILLNLDDRTKKNLLELVFYVPQIQESSFKIFMKLIRNEDFPIQSCLYFLQIIHHRFSLEEKTVERTAKYIGFMLSIMIGNEEDKTAGSHCYEVTKEADNKFLTRSMKWERTLDIGKAVCLHMNQYGDTSQIIQILTTFLYKFQSTAIQLTEQQLISLMILTNDMDFHKYPITDSFTDSIVPHFWTFCKQVTVTESCLLGLSVEKFKSQHSVVIETLIDSLCQTKNGLPLLISAVKKDLYDSKSTLPELKVVCQAGSLWLRHYDTWMQRSNSPIEITIEIRNAVDVIQESCSDLRQHQWWSDFSFLVSRLKL